MDAARGGGALVVSTAWMWTLQHGPDRSEARAIVLTSLSPGGWRESPWVTGLPWVTGECAPEEDPASQSLGRGRVGTRAEVGARTRMWTRGRRAATIAGLLVEPPSLVAGLVFKTSGAARERRSGGSIPLLYRFGRPLAGSADIELISREMQSARWKDDAQSAGTP